MQYLSDGFELRPFWDLPLLEVAHRAMDGDWDCVPVTQRQLPILLTQFESHIQRAFLSRMLLLKGWFGCIHLVSLVKTSWLNSRFYLRGPKQERPFIVPFRKRNRQQEIRENGMTRLTFTVRARGPY
jgi:hypothetical protein